MRHTKWNLFLLFQASPAPRTPVTWATAPFPTTFSPATTSPPAWSQNSSKMLLPTCSSARVSVLTMISSQLTPSCAISSPRKLVPLTRGNRLWREFWTHWSSWNPKVDFLSGIIWFWSTPCAKANVTETRGASPSWDFWSGSWARMFCPGGSNSSAQSGLAFLTWQRSYPFRDSGS